MRTYKVTLKPQAPLTSVPSSETLFGALCWGIRLLYGESKLREMLSGFVSDDPAFVISSSFPVSSSGTLFFPKPKIKRLNPEEIRDVAKAYSKFEYKNPKESLFEVVDKYKKFSKIPYLSETLFRSVLEGRADEKSLFNDFTEERVIERSRFLLKREEKELADKFIQDEIRVRTRIDRLSNSTTGEGQMFHSETKMISGGFSLFFILKTDNIEFLKPFLDRDKFLSDHGIGGDRNIGLNHFKVLMEEIDSKFEGGSKNFVTLSKYIPSPGEINVKSGRISYEVVPYVSRVDNSYDFQGERFIKDRVFYMNEGSLFESVEKKEFYGKVIEVCNIGGKRIYQNGLAFPVFFNS